jgi:hypothetical protein
VTTTDSTGILLAGTPDLATPNNTGWHRLREGRGAIDRDAQNIAMRVLVAKNKN